MGLCVEGGTQGSDDSSVIPEQSQGFKDDPRGLWHVQDGSIKGLFCCLWPHGHEVCSIHKSPKTVWCKGKRGGGGRHGIKQESEFDNFTRES